MAPLVLVGTRVGMAASARWSTEHLNRGALVVLVAIALSSILAPFLSP